MVDNLARKLDNAPKAEIEISEAPVKWCSVSLAEMVERGKRLEASVFDLFEGGRVLRQINGVVTHAQLCELLFGGFALRVARIGEDGHGHCFSSLCNRLPLVRKILSATFFDFARLLGPFISIHYP